MMTDKRKFIGVIIVCAVMTLTIYKTLTLRRISIQRNDVENDGVSHARDSFDHPTPVPGHPTPVPGEGSKSECPRYWRKHNEEQCCKDHVGFDLDYSSVIDNGSCVHMHYEKKLLLTALASFPGSGNTWLRHIIQQTTGMKIDDKSKKRKQKHKQKYNQQTHKEIDAEAKGTISQKNKTRTQTEKNHKQHVQCG